MKFKDFLIQKKTGMRMILSAAVAVFVVSISTFTSEAATGKVTANTATIRSEASTASEAIGSTSKGAAFDVVSGVKDSSGTTWYKVPNGNNTYGYIRGDLIEVSGEVSMETAQAATTTTATTTTAAEATTATKPEATVPTSVEEKTATISQASARIRSGASTSHDTLTSLKSGETVTIIGEATDSKGNLWYQVRYGESKEGYVRSDLVTIVESTPAEGTEGENGEGTEGEGENAEGTEGEEAEPEVPAEPEHNDYEVVYNDDTYWLYDNVNGTMMSVTNLLDVVEQVNADNSKLQSQNKTEKILIIVLAVLLVILIVTVTILIFKLRDAYYYEEEYEEEEEEPVEVAPKKRRRAREEYEEEEQEPVRRKEKRRPVEEREEEPERPRKKRREPEAELTAAEEKKPAKKAAPRKSQNFLVDDDEFEFEFLNMDDKD